ARRHPWLVRHSRSRGLSQLPSVAWCDEERLGEPHYRPKLTPDEMYARQAERKVAERARCYGESLGSTCSLPIPERVIRVARGSQTLDSASPSSGNAGSINGARATRRAASTARNASSRLRAIKVTSGRGTPRSRALKSFQIKLLKKITNP